ATRRALAAPAELLEEPPDVTRVILHAARLLDQHGDAPRGPETRVEAERLGTALESLFHAPELDGAELRLAPRAARLLQAGAAGHHELPCPPIHRLPMDTDLPGDLRFAQPMLEQRRRLESPHLERIEIPPHPRRIPHAGRIAHPDRFVTILRGTQ